MLSELHIFRVMSGSVTMLLLVVCSRLHPWVSTEITWNTDLQKLKLAPVKMNWDREVNEVLYLKQTTLEVDSLDTSRHAGAGASLVLFLRCSPHI